MLGDAAAGEFGSLPLLSVVLETLYRRDIAGGRDGGTALTFATYGALGEARGAIARRAEDTLSAVEAADPTAAAGLPRVLRALVTTSDGDTITARPAPLAAFAERSPERRLVGAFLAPDTRLLTATGDGASADLRLAHDALIAHWPRAKAQIAKDRRDIETRAQLQNLLRRHDEAVAQDPQRAPRRARPRAGRRPRPRLGDPGGRPACAVREGIGRRGPLAPRSPLRRHPRARPRQHRDAGGVTVGRRPRPDGGG